MSSTNPIFLFEISIEDVNSFVPCKKFSIKCQFKDIFMVELRNPNELYAESFLPRKRNKQKVRGGVVPNPRCLTPSTKNALVAMDAKQLLTAMQQYPVELVLWSKANPYALGVVQIPWKQEFLYYMKHQKRTVYPAPVFREKFDVYDEYSSRRMANVKFKIQLSQMPSGSVHGDRESPIQIQRQSKSKVNLFPAEGIENKALSPETTGIIRTIYNGGKRNASAPQRKTGRKKDGAVMTDQQQSEKAVAVVDKKQVPVKKEKIKGITKEGSVEKRSANKEHRIKETAPQELRRLASFTFRSDSEDDDSLQEYTDAKRGLNEDNIETMLRHHYEHMIESNIRIQTLTNIISYAKHQKHGTPHANLVRSETNISAKGNEGIDLKRPVSYSTIEVQQRLKTMNYIFGDPKGQFGHKVYWVEYFTVQNASVDTPSSQQSPSKTGDKTTSSQKSDDTSQCFKFKICDDDCKVKGVDGNPVFDNTCATDISGALAHTFDIKKCMATVECDDKRGIDRTQLLPYDKPVYLNFPRDAPEEKDKGKYDFYEDPCFCTCECTFKFGNQTTYCKICGGFEKAGDDINNASKDPYPCPIYHNLVEKDKKTKGKDQSDKDKRSQKGRGGSDKLSSVEKPISESEEAERKRKKNIMEKFKNFFNYGYTAPKIGHGNCTSMCGGAQSYDPNAEDWLNVPRHMGWLWTAANVPGLKFRPGYRPGAINKKVINLLRSAAQPGLVIARRKKKEAPKKKNKAFMKRPLLVVKKLNGEYKITMETMKQYPKLRYPNQQPFEDKEAITYTIGRTEAENRERAKRKAREQRRLERYQREFIQSAFRDMCKEICMNTYRQALQFLPHTEDPPCEDVCFPALPNAERVDLEHSCSCSEMDQSSIGSQTDEDEWIVEFSPPVAYFNPKFEGKKVTKVDNETQYTYLDYRVKLLDRSGNQVPRFFKGPDGTVQCSDLGGFWGPDGKWLEINEDGFIGPDGRWAPKFFIGPGGEQVDASTGKFQLGSDPDWIVVGVDGYVDCTGHWKYYRAPVKKIDTKVAAAPAAPKKKAKKPGTKQSSSPDASAFEAIWSEYGDDRHLKCLGIFQPRPQQPGYPTSYTPAAAGAAARGDKQTSEASAPKSTKHKKGKPWDQHRFSWDRKCRHNPPSDKGIIAMDGRGNKIYFRLKDHVSQRSKERLMALEKEGFSLSSFHVPCFSSFINSEMMRQQQIEHILRHNERVASARSHEMAEGQ